MDDLLDGMGLPFVSVIMPVRNEAKFIAASLGAVLSQHYPPQRMEILIADGKSTDDTVQIIRSLPGSERVKIVPNPKRLQAAGMNVALHAARGDIVVRIDGHTIVEPDYISQCVRALQVSGAQNAGGSIRPVGTSPKSRAIASAARSQFAVPGPFHLELPKDAPGKYTDTVYMGAWPRDVLLRVGGFNEKLAVNEDYELNHRILQAGGRIYFSPAIRSQYYPRERYRSLARQYFRYGRGKITAVRVNPGSLHVRHLVPPAFVAMLALGAGLALLIPLTLFFVGGLVLIYLLLAIVFGLQTKRHFPRGERSSVWRTALVFPLMHLSWGIGFWFGLVLPLRSSAKEEPTPVSQVHHPSGDPVGVRQSHLSR
jgi:glycosyltransferase involved in cell wall biosynthesis